MEAWGRGMDGAPAPIPPPTGSEARQPCGWGVVGSRAGSVVDRLRGGRALAVGAELAVHPLPHPRMQRPQLRAQASHQDWLSLVTSLS